ncbi:MAG: peptidoglycan DD-metalloendopeptidase family protein [Ignavibacteriae bacterium]|nr:peptidase M23 [Ignavibacteriota bacterium]NOG97938.1 peptidoglycan DD-metalloendopeptidase family protein [Ignavibacteriota bacterium]
MYNSFSNIISIDYKNEPFSILDLSKTNNELQTLQFNKTGAFSKYVNSKIESANAKFAIGKYGEDRIIYNDSTVFKGSERRSIHLGIDFWTEAGVDVFAPLDSEVHSFKNNNNSGDYGPTIILMHKNESQVLYTLYGHLSLSSIQNLEVGKKFSRGDKIGEIGNTDVNGNWPPHLHFQLITNMLNYHGDFPGVCKPSEKEKFFQLSPNPNTVLKIPELD